MVEDSNDTPQPEETENHAELLRRIDELKVEAIRRRLETIEREALHSHAIPDELVRALLMSTLQDCRRAQGLRMKFLPPAVP